MRSTALVVMLALVGCVEHDADELVATPRQGRVEVTYAIGGSATLDACDAIGAARFEVAVRVTPAEPEPGRADPAPPYATASVTCGDFRVTLDLPPGRYEADARLFDEHGDAVTRSVALGRFSLGPASLTKLTADFDETLML